MVRARNSSWSLELAVRLQGWGVGVHDEMGERNHTHKQRERERESARSQREAQAQARAQTQAKTDVQIGTHL